jgi:DNA-binding NarL/FixJ family response regulator
VTIKVVLGEDSYLVREGLERILSSDPELELVASCGDFDELRAAVDRLRPDVVLTDIRMPPGETDEGIRLAIELRRSHPDLGVVVLSQHASSVYAGELFADGAARRGYVLKDGIADGSELVRVIRQISSGGTHLDPAVFDVVFAGWEHEDTDQLKRLTPREHEVLELVASGDTNAVIAVKLGISKRAVERHLNSIFAKLELHDAEHVSRRVKATLEYLRRR